MYYEPAISHQWPLGTLKSSESLKCIEAGSAGRGGGARPGLDTADTAADRGRKPRWYAPQPTTRNSKHEPQDPSIRIPFNRIVVRPLYQNVGPKKGGLKTKQSWKEKLYCQCVIFLLFFYCSYCLLLFSLLHLASTNPSLLKLGVLPKSLEFGLEAYYPPQ